VPKSNPMSPALLKRTEIVRTEYGDYQQFLVRFNPKIQEVIQSYGSNYVSVNEMKYPSMAILGHTYTNEAIIEWVKIQFFDLNNFVGVKEKLLPPQINQLSSLFFYDCYFLNIAEVAMFFLKYKLGAFGEFYGVVDPLKIMTAKVQFLNERMTALNRRRMELQQKEDDLKRDRLELIKNEHLKRLADQNKMRKQNFLNKKKKWKRMDLL